MDAKSILKVLKARSQMSWVQIANELGIPGGKQGAFSHLLQRRDINLPMFVSACELMGCEIIVRPVSRTGLPVEWRLDNSDEYQTPEGQAELKARLAEVRAEQREAAKSRPKKKAGRKFAHIPQTYAPALAPAPDLSTFADSAPVPAEILAPDPADDASADSGEPSSEPKQSPW